MRGIMRSMTPVDEVAFISDEDMEEAYAAASKGLKTMSFNPEKEAMVEVVSGISETRTYEVIAEERKLVAIGDALVKADDIIDKTVPLVKPGQTITFLDSENALAVLEAKVITFCKLPIPNDYVVILVRVKNRFYVAVHKNDWLRMGDNIRSVEYDALDTVAAFLEKKKASYLTVASCGYGGTKGLSISYAANRLWKPITGHKLDPKVLTI